MADENKSTTAKRPQVTLQVPVGMTAEQFAKLVGTFVKGNDRGKKVGKAIGEAIKRLKIAHKDEYRSILREEYVKQGLDPATIK